MDQATDLTERLTRIGRLLDDLVRRQRESVQQALAIAERAKALDPSPIWPWDDEDQPA